MSNAIQRRLTFPFCRAGFAKYMPSVVFVHAKTSSISSGSKYSDKNLKGCHLGC